MNINKNEDYLQLTVGVDGFLWNVEEILCPPRILGVGVTREGDKCKSSLEVDEIVSSESTGGNTLGVSKLPDEVEWLICKI